MSLVSENSCDRHAGTPHSDYPHHPGQHYGCYACEIACHCNVPGVLQGRQTICVSSVHDHEDVDMDDEY